MGGNTMKMNKKGFTLIELLIVVAIIAILAAIAIPQFSKYRVRGYNTAADSDLRNMKIAIVAFSTDNSAYASTVGCVSATSICGAGGAPGAMVLLAGPYQYTITTAQYAIVATLYPSQDVTWSLGLSNGVLAGISTSANGANYVAITANTSGDTVYAGADTVTALLRAGKDAGGLPVALTAGVTGAPLTYTPASTGVEPTVPTDLDANFVAM